MTNRVLRKDKKGKKDKAVKSKKEEAVLTNKTTLGAQPDNQLLRQKNS